jgi:hypothetical protein
VPPLSEEAVVRKRISIFLSVLALLSVFAGSAAAARSSDSPACVGALNMLNDATMATVPMTHDAAQGNVGMFTAVDASGCTP